MFFPCSKPWNLQAASLAAASLLSALGAKKSEDAPKNCKRTELRGNYFCCRKKLKKKKVKKRRRKKKRELFRMTERGVAESTRRYDKEYDSQLVSSSLATVQQLYRLVPWQMLQSRLGSTMLCLDSGSLGAECLWRC